MSWGKALGHLVKAFGYAAYGEGDDEADAHAIQAPRRRRKKPCCTAKRSDPTGAGASETGPVLPVRPKGGR